GDSFLLHSSATRWYTFEKRTAEEKVSKTAIGNLCAELLWRDFGQKETLRDTPERGERSGTEARRAPEGNGRTVSAGAQQREGSGDTALRMEQVRRDLETDRRASRTQAKNRQLDGPAAQQVQKVCDFLEDYWRKSHRIACLDAGTTTYAIANALADEETASTCRRST